ncbi:Protein SYM1 [Hondaea fermentalgiana]|uniref:Protein SYM1 n=1 Tax=Hondaea fermentalgiana TaxID=2315210 RepID=A0A2R5GPQ5_9STRA|nr:Protein SYM1 [Hondaea fermentalgiana]|eukprot:GBG30321.1 Protein SYM1 [Hondaea fermentalgiana]
MRAALRGVGAAYDGALRRRPVLVKCLTSGAIAGAGDLVAQLVLDPAPVLKEGNSTASATTSETGRDEPATLDGKANLASKEAHTSLDLARLARFSLLGGVLVGPTLHVWYGYLGTRIAGRSLAATIKRVVLDQAVFTPLFLPVFLTCLGALEGKSIRHTLEGVRSIWAPTVVYNWAWWTPVQLANFGVVPAQYQVLVSNAAGVVWNSYLSFTNQRARRRAAAIQDNETQS